MIESAPQGAAPARSREHRPGEPAASTGGPARGRFTFTGSLRSRAARGTVLNSAFAVAIGLLALLKGFILAGFLSRADYGVWGIIIVSLSTLVWLKQTGIGDKFIQQDELDQELAFQRAFTLELLVSVACVALIALALPVLVLIYDLPQIIAPSAVIAGALLVSAFQSPLWIFYRRMQFGRERALAAIDPVVGFVVSIALAVAGAGYWAFVGGIAAGICVSAAVAVLCSPYTLAVRLERETLGRYWSFSMPLLVSGAATFVMAWSAVIAAKIDLGLAAVGVLALADNVSAYSERVDDVVSGGLYPAICAVKDRLELLRESLIKSNRLALMWAVPFGIGLALFAQDLVRFGIGERWQPAVIVLEVYGITAAVGHIGFNWTSYFQAIGQTRPIAVASVAAAATFLLTGIPLLLAFGLPGFAIGILLQALAALLIRVLYLRRLFPAFDFVKHASRSFLPVLPAVTAVLALRALDPGGRSLAFALGELAIFVIVTAVATWYMESRLLREAFGYVLDRRATPAVF